MNWKILPLSVIALAFIFSSCRKDIVDDDPSLRLAFSTDTLTFDTVFTTLASTTLYFKVYNNNRNSVKTNVTLAGGENSNFRINADGIAGNQQGLEIYGKDSTYVFVEVTVDPNGLNTPLIITDSVIFETNGNRQKVILAAWGQDANYFNDSILPAITTWTNNKPYVIFNTAVVDSGGTLFIQQGTQIYMGGRAQLIVLGTGKIEVAGTKDNPVVFQGVRLEEFYDDLPGQWNGIFILRGSTGNSFDYAEIKNANYGIHIGYPYPTDSCDNFVASFSAANMPVLSIKNTIIKNSFVNGVFAAFADLDMENTLVYNSGDHLVSFGFGGIYDITHCTFANYGANTINHQTPTLFLSNNLTCGTDGPVNVAEIVATFTNTIVYGSLEEEINFYFIDTSFYTALFDNCLLKTEQDDTLEFAECIFNLDPLFTDRSEDDYTITDNSPCRDSGRITNTVFTDLKGFSRDAQPDIGAYEFE